MKTALCLFGLMALMLQVIAEPGIPKTERAWKRLLSNRRYEQGMARAAVEELISAKVFVEFDADWGFALLRTVYYELDQTWYACATYRSPGGANITTGSNRPTMLLVGGPMLVRNTPEEQAKINRLKVLRP